MTDDLPTASAITALSGDNRVITLIKSDLLANRHNGKGFTILIAGKRYAAFPPKQKAAVQPAATEGESA